MVPVSVIIPTFNRKAFLAEALESVYAQTFVDFEVIVVDDGSTDGTSAMASAHRKVRWLFQDHQGVSAARNSGIRAAKGTYVAWLDSDDLWEPEKLCRQVEFHRRNPQSWISQTEETWIRHGRWANPRKKHKKVGGWIFRECLPLCIVSPSAVMMRRKLFDVVGLFDEDLPACEDYDMWLRLSWRYPVDLIPERLVIKRGGHPDQLSSTVKALDRFRIRAIEKVLGASGLDESLREAAIAELELKCSIYAAGCLKRGRQDEALRYGKLADQYRRRGG